MIATQNGEVALGVFKTVAPMSSIVAAQTDPSIDAMSLRSPVRRGIFPNSSSESPENLWYKNTVHRFVFLFVRPEIDPVSFPRFTEKALTSTFAITTTHPAHLADK